MDDDGYELQFRLNYDKVKIFQTSAMYNAQRGIDVTVHECKRFNDDTYKRRSRRIFFDQSRYGESCEDNEAADEQHQLLHPSRYDLQTNLYAEQLESCGYILPKVMR